MIETEKIKFLALSIILRISLQTRELNHIKNFNHRAKTFARTLNQVKNIIVITRNER